MHRIILLFFLPSLVVAQQYHLSGLITDHVSGELLSQATIFEKNSARGTVADSDGYYYLSFNAYDTLHLSYSFIGYASIDTTFVLTANTQLDIALQSGFALTTVEVKATSKSTNQVNLPSDVATLSIAEIKNLPTLVGEQDPIKSLQLLPGVQGGAEGSSGLYVRGGSSDQNLFLLDGATVYNPTHVGGFLSIVDANAIKNVEIIKGGFPAEYGSRISSVIDVEIKDGNKQKHLQTVAVNPVSSKILAEGPLARTKSSYLVAGRRTFLDLLAPIFQSGQDFRAGFALYDIYSKLNFVINDNNRLTTSFYSGRDRLYFTASGEDELLGTLTDFSARELIAWGNDVGSVNWWHRFSNRLQMTASSSFSRYQYHISSGIGRSEEEFSVNDYFESGNQINDYSSSVKFKYHTGENQLKFGLQYSYLKTVPGRLLTTRSENGQLVSENQQTADFAASNAAIYVNYRRTLLANNLYLNGGLRLESYLLPTKMLVSLQPRVSLRYRKSDRLQFTFSYAHAQQPVHFVTTSGAGLPTDFWLPATENLRPQRGHILSLGGTFNPFKSDKIELNSSIFYKTLNNLIAIREGISIFQNTIDWENRVHGGGRGTVYGVELLLKGNFGKWSNWISYTLSNNQRTFTQLNGGHPFNYKYGRRHDLSVVFNYQFSKHISFSGTWIFNSGNYLTLATAQYPVHIFGTLNQSGQQRTGFLPIPAHYYGGRNQFQTPAYHRFDFSFNFEKVKRKGVRTWKLGLYNAYNQANPFFIYYDRNESGGNTLKGITIFPILPSITFEWQKT